MIWTGGSPPPQLVHEIKRAAPVALEIPDVVIDRLPLYYRVLRSLQANEEVTVSSERLGQALNMTAAQVRKDLSYFGRFGKQGQGYSVRRLSEELRTILGVDRRWPVVLVGVGHLGEAIASYRGFEPEGFEVVGAYDVNPDVVGARINDGLVVRSLTELEHDLRLGGVDIGIVAVPAADAQGIIDILVSAGIKAILSYAPADARVPAGVELRQIDPLLSLQEMTYHLRRRG
jgi:redox-sensing transcriptional repressor